MRKTKEVLRLRFELGLGQRAIARACSISQGAVHNYLKKAALSGIGWPIAGGMGRKTSGTCAFRRAAFLWNGTHAQSPPRLSAMHSSCSSIAISPDS